jgi:cell division cycle 14
MEMVREFITISERIIEEGGVVAVHCKAGLGRTGTLIGAFLIYKYRFTAEEAIGFMRIMRPGTCVGFVVDQLTFLSSIDYFDPLGDFSGLHARVIGFHRPQQHFLYENQLTWIEWAARDELLADQQAQITPSTTERPITPPPENVVVPTIALSSATATPPPKPLASGSTTMPTSAVPGQPRKTPGAKTRHMVAAPEGKTTGKSLIEQEEAQEQTTEGEEEDAVMQSRPVTRQAHAQKLGPGSPVKASNPAPVAKTRPRPASALSDHRPRNQAPVPAGIVRRSKAVKDLGTLFEGSSAKTGNQKTSSATTSTIPTRYNLRGAGTRAVSGLSSHNTNQANGHTQPSSPSRLPQRVAGVKKRGCTATGPSNVHKNELLNLRVTEVRNGTSHHHLRDHHKHLNGASNNLNPLDRRNVGASLGLDEDQRSVRRRRSSLSHTDLAI